MPGDIADPQWARLTSDENRGLRRGAWYRVVATTPGEAVLDVNRRRVPLPRASLQFVSTPPQTWTVVSRPPDAHGLPTGWDDKYAVCPSCRNRAPLKQSDLTLRCQRCGGLFRVAWDEWFLTRS